MRSSWLLVAAALLWTSPVAADVGETRESARKLAEEGIALFDQKQFEQALVKLEAAERIFHAPTHLLFIAQTQTKLGRLGAARATYEKLIAEPLPNYAPDAFREAQQQARVELAELAPRVPTLTIVVRGASAAGATVSVDGAPAVAIGGAIPLDPGKHDLIVASSGRPDRRLSVELAEREQRSLEVAFQEDGSPARPGEAPPPSPPGGEPTGETSLVVPMMIGFGVGAAGLVVGSVTGALSLDKVSDLEGRCPTKTGCDPADEVLADDARLLGNVSTAGFVVGGVGVAAGAVLLVLELTGDEAAAPRTSGVELGPGWVGYHGVF